MKFSTIAFVGVAAASRRFMAEGDCSGFTADKVCVKATDDTASSVYSVKFGGVAPSDIDTPKKCATLAVAAVTGEKNGCASYWTMVLPRELTAGGSANDGWCVAAEGKTCADADATVATANACGWFIGAPTVADWAPTKAAYEFAAGTGNVADSSYDATTSGTVTSVWKDDTTLLDDLTWTSAAMTLDGDDTVEQLCAAAAGGDAEEDSAAFLKGAALAASMAMVAATL